MLPAVAALQATGGLDPDFQFVGAGPQSWSTEDFAAHARQQLAAHASPVAVAHQEALIAAVRYYQADVRSRGDVATVLDSVIAEAGSGPVAVYLALPTQVMLAAVRAVRACDLPPGGRIAIEKPFGYDLDSAVELDAALANGETLTDAGTVYRVDHAMAMTGMRQLSRVVRPGTTDPIIWNSQRLSRWTCCGRRRPP